MTTQPSRRVLAALLAVLAAGALLRAWSLNQVRGSFLPPMDQDEGYYEQGVGLLSRGVFSLGLTDGRPRAWRGPVFPAFAALSEVPFRAPSPGHLRLAQQLLSVLGVAFAFWLGLRAAGPRAALAGAALLALDPGQVASANSLNVHAFYGLALLALAGAAAFWAEKPGRGRGLLLGAAFGATLLARSTHFLSVPLVLAVGAFRGDGWGRALRRAAWPALGFALAAAPWTARNAVQFRRFQPLDSYSGAVNFYMASLGERGSFDVDAAVARAEPERPGLGAVYAADRDAVFPLLLALGKKHVLADPLGYARSTARRGLDLYGPWWPALLLAAFGVWRRRRSRETLAVAAVAASLAAYALVGVQAAYADAARPLLCVLAGWGLASLLDFAPKRSAHAPAGAAAEKLARAAALAFAAVFCGTLLFADGLILREPFLARAPAPGADAVLPQPRDGRAAALTELYARRAPRRDGDAARGMMLADAGRGAEACAAFEAAWRADPKRFDAGLRAADCRARAGNGPGALDAAKRLLVSAVGRSRADQGRARAALARALAASGRKTEAGGEWARAAALAPDDAEVRRGAAAGLLAAGRAGQALPLAEAAVAADAGAPPSARSVDLTLRAQILLALGRRDAAVADLRAAASSGAAGRAALAAAAGAAGAAKRFADSLALADLLVEAASRGTKPEAAWARVVRGRARLLAGKTAEADEDFSAASDLDPGATAAWDDYLAWLKSLRDRRRDADARAALDRSLAGPLAGAAGPVRASALAARAALRGDAGDRAGSDADFAAALAADADAACRHAPDLVDPGREPSARFADCLKIYPKDGRLLADQGVALWNEGRKDEARASLRAALDADPGDLSAALSLQAVLGGAGGDEARRRLTAALAASKAPKDSPLRADARAALGGR